MKAKQIIFIPFVVVDIGSTPTIAAARTAMAILHLTAIMDLDSVSFLEKSNNATQIVPETSFPHS